MTTNKLMREEFEAWCKTYHHATMEFGEYTSDYTDFAWKAWQAAAAARNKHSETVPKEGTKVPIVENRINQFASMDADGGFYQNMGIKITDSTKHSLPENPWQHGNEYVEPFQPKTSDHFREVTEKVDLPTER